MIVAAMHIAEKKVRASIVAGVDAPPVLELTEHIFDFMALAINRPQGQIDHPLNGVGRQRGLPGLRVLSRNSPSTPSAMNRACQVHTTGFDLPDRRMISAVPQPSAVARITLARHTCFCGALRSATIASSRRRSARVTLTTNSCSHNES